MCVPYKLLVSRQCYTKLLHSKKASVNKQLEILNLCLLPNYKPVIVHTFKQQANL